jgi:molecular chaperone DnaK (HSP70)
VSNDVTTYFGIDLGTTYSAIAYIDENGRAAVVRSHYTNEETMPSVVYFESASNVIVGRTAKDVARLYPEKVVGLVKRKMGRDSEWNFDGTTYTAESISAFILKQLAQDAEAYSGQKVEKVVVTVPAYFGMLERDATKNAGRLAGLDVISIVPEPVAAAMHYDVVADADGKMVLIYDLGGGTFDTTVIRIASDAIDVLCTDGDQELGGTDWDAYLIEHLLTEFEAQASPTEDPREDEHFMQDLAMIAEEAKRQLSQVTSRTVPLRFGGASAMVTVERETFEQGTSHLLERTIEYTRRTLRSLAEKVPGATKDSIDRVLLVGGSSKMPAVARRLNEEFGWDAQLHEPDLSVAKGAARFALGQALWNWGGADDAPIDADAAAARLEEGISAVSARTGVADTALRAMAQKRVTTVLPKAFGVRLVDTDQPGWRNDPDAASYIEHLVHANDTLPAGPVVFEAATVEDGQTAVTIDLYEQAGSQEARDLAANKPVDQASGEISGLPPLPADSPIELTMQVDREGLLCLTGREPSTDRELIIEVRVSMLSDEAFAAQKKAVSALTVKA